MLPAFSFAEQFRGRHHTAPQQLVTKYYWLRRGVAAAGTEPLVEANKEAGLAGAKRSDCHCGRGAMQVVAKSAKAQVISRKTRAGK